MSEENTEILEDATTEEDLQEFKADDGQSEVPEPVATKKKKSTKVGMLNDMMTKLHGMNKETLQGLHSKMMEEVEDDDSEEIVEDTTDEDAITVSSEDIDLSADVAAMFGDEELSEEFKQNQKEKNRLKAQLKKLKLLMILM